MPLTRIISLVPSCTEIVCALGVEARLIGRSHQCDFPDTIGQLPECSRSTIDTAAASGEIDRQVKEKLASSQEIVAVDREKVASLMPDLILAQDQCEACAVTPGQLQESGIRVLSLAPSTLAEVWESIAEIADALDLSSHGRILVKGLKTRMVDVIAKACVVKHRPSVVCLEWIDPLMNAGHWIPDMVELGGGSDVLGESGKAAKVLRVQELIEKNPEILILMPCGFDRERTRQESRVLCNRPEWSQLQAVRKRRVFLADGNHYFNRPGPRLVESMESLAEILHPKLFSFGWEGKIWERL